MIDLRLDGKTALITGGSRGLGKAVSEQFGAAGATLMIAARGSDALAETAAEISRRTGATVLTSTCDVGRASDLDDLYNVAEAGLGRVDILVNNAGGSSHGGIEEVSDARWQRDFDVKLFAIVRLCRLILPGMRERRWGRILNMASIVAKTPGPQSAPTTVSRAAAIALTKVIAHEYAQYNITANVICPGRIMSTQWERRHLQDAPEVDFETYRRNLGKVIPAGRIGEPHELAGLALFLASDAGSYITGTAINVDGGKSPVI